MQTETLNILLSTDNNYVMPTGVLMTSICENNKNIVFFILTDSKFNVSNKKKLINIANKYGSLVLFFTITSDKVNIFPFGKSGQPRHVSIATYYRLFITEILPKNIHKILYLDCDMIVRHDLSELYKTDLSSHALGVVHDCDEHKHPQRLGYSLEKGYFNAGMLFINLDYWRKNNVLHAFTECINKHSNKILYHDQDILNIVFCDNKLWLPMKYNFQTNYTFRQNLPCYPPKYHKEADFAKKNPTIIHYLGPDKPWKTLCAHPHQDVWRFYWKKTQWYNPKSISFFFASLVGMIKKIILIHNLYKSIYEYSKCYLNK